MVEPFASRSGLPSLRVDGVALHSPYDPVAEARRFARERLGAAPASTVVLLGEGLGYLGAAVTEAMPAARLVAICYAPEVDRHAVRRADAAWNPSSPEGLGGFLRRAIGELDVEGLRVIEWPASARIFPAASREANLAVRTVVRELNGSCATAAAMGRLWLRSALWNLVSIDTVLDGDPCSPERPVVIAASGPSLARCLPDLARVRAGIDLWALPSAAEALAAEGLPPDIVVLTDPGHWAMVHLHFAGVRCPVFMPLSAARGAWRTGNPVRILSQGTFLERELLTAAGVAVPLVEPHGTVAATALDLALASTRGPVALAGLDLCALDSGTHVRPNAFDALLRAADDRLSPFHGLAYARARTAESGSRIIDGVRVRVSRSLDTYAGWLAHRASTAPGRIFPAPSFPRRAARRRLPRRRGSRDDRLGGSDLRPGTAAAAGAPVAAGCVAKGRGTCRARALGGHSRTGCSGDRLRLVDRGPGGIRRARGSRVARVGPRSHRRETPPEARGRPGRAGRGNDAFRGRGVVRPLARKASRRRGSRTVDRLLEANLRSLAVRHPRLAGAVQSAAQDSGLSFAVSASGHPVPVRRDGAALHSRVDPVREARRLAATLPPFGVAVFLGLGGGYVTGSDAWAPAASSPG